MVPIQKKQKYFPVVVVFSILALSFHMAALKLVYNSIGLLLGANGAVSEIQNAVKAQVANLKRYSEYCTFSFFLVTYFFVFFIGFKLISRKIKLKMYIASYLLFEAIQITGLTLFIQIFNKYELTEGFGRWRILHRHPLLWIMLIIPIIICLLRKNKR